MKDRSDTSAVEALAEAVPVAVCLVEADESAGSPPRVRFSNEAARARFGEALGAGSAVDTVFPPEVVIGDASDACRRASIQGDPEALRLRRPDGSTETALGDVLVVRRLNPNVVALMCDASGADWQRAEFHAVVDSALEAILTKTLDGTILSWNFAAGRMYGYSEAEAVGMPITTLLPPDRQREVAGIIGRLKTGERISEFETRRVRKDGSIVDVSLTITPVRGPSGLIVGAATIARDVTERKFDEERQRLAAIVESAFYPVFSVDLDGRILTWNGAAERLFGYSAEKMVGSPAGALLGPALVSPSKTSEWPDAADVEPFEAVTVTASGAEIVVEAAVSAIRDERGEVAAAAVVLRDVTTQRQLEERLRQKQKMEAIGSLASGVGHDFNNVLSVIRSASGLLAMELHDPALGELVEEIDRAATHAAELTAQLLAFGRLQCLRPEPTDLGEHLGSVLGMVRSLLPQGVRVERDLALGLPAIQVDRTQLTQVLINLCGNAGDAMPEGGELTISTRLGAPAPGGADPTDVVLEVRDTGAGMDPKTLDRLFDPFYTTKETGTGLGLATVHGIVEQSGGSIEVDSTEGVGTVFRVHFPVAEGGALAGIG